MDLLILSSTVQRGARVLWWAWLLLEVLLPASWLLLAADVLGRPSGEGLHLLLLLFQLVSLSEARLLLEEDDYLLKAVFDYWLRKRKSCLRPSLIPHVRQERRDGSTNGDAYVAFRRRREKMQTRKVSHAAHHLIEHLDQLQVLRSSRPRPQDLQGIA